MASRIWLFPQGFVDLILRSQRFVEIEIVLPLTCQRVEVSMDELSLDSCFARQRVDQDPVEALASGGRLSLEGLLDLNGHAPNGELYRALQDRRRSRPILGLRVGAARPTSTSPHDAYIVVV